MGISGCGKSTVGSRLSKRLGVPFLDADDFHPKSSVVKMSAGQPLTDEDRWPWLGAISQHILDSHRNGFILGCSALKNSYRDYLKQRLDITLVYLKLSEQEAVDRLNQRSDHFMPAGLVRSQLDTLEEPINDGLVINAKLPIHDILNQIETFLKA